MNKYKYNELIEHLSLILVLSFLFIKNIYLVLIGITLALYKLNENFLSKLINSLVIETLKKEIIIIDTSIKKDNKKTDLNNEISKLSLVETIEETGYIPSGHEQGKRDAA